MRSTFFEKCQTENDILHLNVVTLFKEAENVESSTRLHLYEDDDT